MPYVTIRGNVYQDQTGVASVIPVIMTEYGPLEPLVIYLLENAPTHSQSWMNKVVQGVGLLLDYMSANHNYFENPQDLFRTFSQRMYSGTIGLDGGDPSGLYWQGKDVSLVKQLVNYISNFSDWMAEKNNSKPLNPWREATRHEEMLNWAAWHQKRDRAFLSHLWDRDVAKLQMKKVRNTLLMREPVIDGEEVKSFPIDRIYDLIFEGFIVPGKQKSPLIAERLNLRDILITMLMHFGGLRMSEAFHLYVQDVIPDPTQTDRALVKIYHPSLGTAPPDWFDAKGDPRNCRRMTYLNGKYGMRPRNEYVSSAQLHAGWKGNVLVSKNNFMYVDWFPAKAGEFFWKLWILYMTQRAMLNCHHPFAFVTLEGKPYAIDTFEGQHRSAIERIGLQASKALGTTPHGHRHAYGQSLAKAGVDPIFVQRAMHHKSLESQKIYTEPDRAEFMRAIEEASERMTSDDALHVPDLREYGLQDIDQLGLMSSIDQKPIRRK